MLINDLQITVLTTSMFDLNTLDPKEIRKSNDLVNAIIDNELIFNDPITGFDLEENECLTVIFGSLIFLECSRKM